MTGNPEVILKLALVGRTPQIDSVGVRRDVFSYTPSLMWPTRPTEEPTPVRLPTYAAGGRIFILSTLISGTRGVKGEAHCAISLRPTPSTPLRAGSCAKNRKNGATPV